MYFKIFKFFYNILKAANYWFAMYYNYYIKIFAIFDLIYNLYLLYKYELFNIIKL